jgi:hypothetical protein
MQYFDQRIDDIQLLPGPPGPKGDRGDRGATLILVSACASHQKTSPTRAVSSGARFRPGDCSPFYPSNGTCDAHITRGIQNGQDQDWALGPDEVYTMENFPHVVGPAVTVWCVGDCLGTYLYGGTVRVRVVFSDESD